LGPDLKTTLPIGYYRELFAENIMSNLISHQAETLAELLSLDPVAERLNRLNANRRGTLGEVMLDDSCWGSWALFAMTDGSTLARRLICTHICAPSTGRVTSPRSRRRASAMEGIISPDGYRGDNKATKICLQTSVTR
jgi:hypothetical protein